MSTLITRTRDVPREFSVTTKVAVFPHLCGLSKNAEEMAMIVLHERTKYDSNEQSLLNKQFLLRIVIPSFKSVTQGNSVKSNEGLWDLPPANISQSLTVVFG